MEILILVVGILTFTGIGFVVKILTHRAVCPICMGVSGTWLSLSIAVVATYLPLATWEMPIALLMGGSIVGIAYQGVQRIAWAAARPVLWKTLVLVPGFALAHAALRNLSLVVIVIEMIILSIIMYAYFWRTRARQYAEYRGGRLAAIKKQLKNCC